MMQCQGMNGIPTAKSKQNVARYKPLHFSKLHTTMQSSDNFDSLWANLKDSIIAARRKQLKVTFTHTSGNAMISRTEVLVSTGEMQLYRDGTTMVTLMTREEALQIATQLISHNA